MRRLMRQTHRSQRGDNGIRSITEPLTKGVGSDETGFDTGESIYGAGSCVERRTYPF
jgi:hypothetical protein